jgi:hypothetical protein
MREEKPPAALHTIERRNSRLIGYYNGFPGPVDIACRDLWPNVQASFCRP